MKKNVLITILLAFVLVLAACQPAPTEEPTTVPTAVIEEPTQAPPTEEPTLPPPTPTLAPIPGDPAVELGVPDGIDPFNEANNWQMFDNQCFSNTIRDGMFFMTAKGLQGTACWTVSWPLVQDYYLETLIQNPQTCQPDDRFGLFFRAPDNLRGYLYGLTCDGRYSLTNWNGSETKVIVQPTANPAILTGPGAVNRIGVVAYGGSYLLYANGQFLMEALNSDFTGPGKIGYFVIASSEQPYTVAFDNMAIWLLSDQYYPPSGTTPPPTQPLPPPAEGASTVTSTTYLNVRTGPSTAYPVLFVAAPGAKGEAIGISADGGWYVVKLPTNVSGNGQGWVSADYVVAENTQGLPVVNPPAPPPTVPPVPPPPTSATVTSFEPINVRTGPGTNYPSYGVAPSYASAAVIGISQDSGWYAVSIPTTIAPDGTGWVSAAYVTLSNPNNQPIPVLPAPVLPPPVSPPPTEPGAPIATAIEPVNVRVGPGNQYPSYGVVGIGASAQVLGISPDGAWYVVALPINISPTGQGWVVAYAASISPADAQLPVVTPPPAP